MDVYTRRRRNLFRFPLLRIHLPLTRPSVRPEMLVPEDCQSVAMTAYRSEHTCPSTRDHYHPLIRKLKVKNKFLSKKNVQSIGNFEEISNL